MEMIDSTTSEQPKMPGPFQRPFRKSDLCVKFEGMLDDRLRQQLLDEGLNPLLIPPVVKTAEVTYLNKIYKGFGIKNRFGGLEFYCNDLPINEKVKGLVTIDQPCQTLYPLKQNTEAERATCSWTGSTTSRI